MTIFEKEFKKLNERNQARFEGFLATLQLFEETPKVKPSQIAQKLQEPFETSPTTKPR